jgi:poly(3-hydroxybutyrate) depolymerase
MKIRRTLLLAVAISLSLAGLAVPAAGPAFAASLTEVTSFGSNPGGMRMHIYVPDARPASPLGPYSLLQESVEQWTNVSGLSQTPSSTDTPQAGWNRRRYGDQVEAYSIQGAGHSLPSTGMAAAAIAFFGITTTPPTTAVNGWSLTFTLPSGQTITSGSNAGYSPTAGQVTARDVGYNAAIAPGGSVSVGFQATHTGNTAPPVSFSLNGAPWEGGFR